MSQTTLEPEPPSQLSRPTAPQAQQLIRQIQRLVSRNTWRWKLLTVVEGLGLVVSALLAYLWLVFWLDNELHLPIAGRVLASCGLLVGFIVLAARLLRRWRLLRFSEDQVALAIEGRTPGGIQNRLINALQLARSAPAEHAELSLAVIEENVSRLKELALEQAAAMRPALVRLSLATLLSAAGLVCYCLQPDRFANAATRILLPLADVEPLYRTTLTVEPGDVEASGDVTLNIEILGQLPEHLTVLQDVAGTRHSELVAVPAPSRRVQHTIRGVEQTLLYAVRGGDYTTRFYQITVPRPSHLSQLEAVYHLPAYTRLADQRVQSPTGELEALRGTRVDVELTLDQPCVETVLIVERSITNLDSPAAAPEPAIERVSLRGVEPTRFVGSFMLDNQSAYQIETRQAGRDPHRSQAYPIRIVADQPPKLELIGLETRSAVAVDEQLPLTAQATDDLGLREVGLFFRRVDEQSQPTGDWQPVEVWTADGQRSWERACELALLTLGVAEGERVEIALRATDHDPAKAGRWTDGTIYSLRVGGEAAALQLLYEQILRSEAELKQIITDERRLLAGAVEWLRKLDGEGNLRWDDPKNVQALHAAVGEQSRQQAALRSRAGRTARAMVEPAGNLRLAVGMLADTEMVRAERIYDSVSAREQMQAKRAALADAAQTGERTVESLQQMLEQYVRFREDWELAHMIGFVKMLADRQAALAEASQALVSRPRDKLRDLRQTSSRRRQNKLLELTGLSRAAFLGMSERVQEFNSPLAAACAAAAEALAVKTLTDAMQQAAAAIDMAQWADAAAQQTAAAEQLTAIHAALRKAQADAARQALAALEELAKTDIEAQRMLEKLKAGSGESFLNVADKLSITDIIHMAELSIRKRGGQGEAESVVNDYLFPDSAVGGLQRPDSGKRQQFEILKLGDNLTKTVSFPAQSDREANKVTPHIQEDFEDLVGKLLEEADEMQEKYETVSLNAAFNINEGGEVGKQGGDMNSTAAAASTGNKKPPTTNVGGASRSGRRGARAHGMLVGDESVNRRGRDKAMEGQERVADQDGTIKETKSDDPQLDTATGIGGKRVESDDTKFSVADAGKWTDDMAQRMGKPQDKNNIVERQDGRMDPRVAEMLRDMTSDHEQIIERVKSIRKELKNLYLPTDHVDEILAELGGQLDRMKERPSPELFRLQQQTLDKLRGAMRVFHQAHAGFQPSVPREQIVRGRVLDDADRPPLPGYEQAVKRYYEKLSVGGQP